MGDFGVSGSDSDGLTRSLPGSLIPESLMRHSVTCQSREDLPLSMPMRTGSVHNSKLDPIRWPTQWESECPAGRRRPISTLAALGSPGRLSGSY
jgi:hypothetical protein